MKGPGILAVYRKLCTVEEKFSIVIEPKRDGWDGRLIWKKRGRCVIPHRLSYEKDLYKKVRIHCVAGRTLPQGQGYEKDNQK